ncbi:MAG: 30S ribosomal protein S17 [Acidimicrobiaceae bacterium]|nr:30S ribosomal protein S17 [Acidimicrobiaceae bacterium]
MSDQSTSENAGEATPLEAEVSETAAAGAETPATGPAPAPAATAASDGKDADKRPNRRKVREGLVVSTSMDKTVVVAAVDRVRHPRYVKTVQRTKRLYAHDENNETRVGDRVRIAETRPMSKLKRWRLVEILERAK